MRACHPPRGDWRRYQCGESGTEAQAAQIALADALGYYNEEGLDATVKWIISGTDMPSLAASGQVKFYGEGNFTTAILRDKNVDMRYVMCTAARNTPRSCPAA